MHRCVPGQGWPHGGLYGKKANSKAGLIHDEAVVASKAILEIPTWMGHFARWRTKCVSVSEASEIVAGCKSLEKENWRRACLELQKRFSGMQVDSMLSATARPFQPQVTPHSSNEDKRQPVYPPRSRWSGSHPTLGLVSSSPVGRMPFHQVVGKAVVAVTLMIHTPQEGGERRRMDFLVKFRFLNSVVRRGILMMWLMPLGNGPDVSLITAIAMRIHTSCLW